MDIETYRNYCLQKKGVSESFPFDNKTLVFKVEGKIFALTDIDNFTFINLKCNPEKAIELREQFMGIMPGYHMSKKHWNSVYLEADVNDKLLVELIDNSYLLVVKSLPKIVQQKLLI